MNAVLVEIRAALTAQCSTGTIRATEGGMGKLGRPRKNLNDAELVTRYEAGESESTLAREMGIGRSSVHRRLLSSGITLRDAVEASDLLRFRIFPTVEPTLELLDGLLLGDASVGDHQASEARLELSQRRDRLAWLLDVEASLRTGQMTVSIADRQERGWQLRTGKYVTLTEQRTRWYPNGVKHVPKDVRLTPLSLAHWYWGDGSTENEGYRMSFCTDSFPKTEVEFLARSLNKLFHWNPTVQHHEKGYRLVVAKSRDRVALTEAIRPYCPQCFEYKLKTKR